MLELTKFIEIPLFLKDNDPDVDYESLGIEGDEPVDSYKTILNVDDIQRVNSTDHPDAETCIWMRDGLCYYTSFTMSDLKRKIQSDYFT